MNLLQGLSAESAQLPSGELGIHTILESENDERGGQEGRTEEKKTPGCVASHECLHGVIASILRDGLIIRNVSEAVSGWNLWSPILAARQGSTSSKDSRSRTFVVD